MVKVSIIVAAYNIEEYIERCIQSIINQTLQEIEIIIVNDGSTDKTLDVIKRCENLNNRIIVVNKENGGVQSARNAGLKEAKGESILFIDGDDWLDKKALYNLYNELQRKEQDIVCYGYYQTTKFNEYNEFRNKYSGKYENEGFLSMALNNKVIPSICCKLIRKEFLDKNNIKLVENIAFGEDLATTIELACHLPKVSILEECYYYYFTRENSVTNKITDKALDLFIAFDYIEKMLVKYGYYNKFKEEYDFLAYYHLYFERIVGQTVFNKTHKKIYYSYRAMKVNINKNKYYKEFKKQLRYNLKIWLYLYKVNYLIAISFVTIWKRVSMMLNSIRRNYCEITN
ncbi:MAG: glycosyltransferase family 2 protein [Clostridium sp.]|nr:glycosyltransferase family 2 protein [Clostridium sp.]MDU7084666.1 glycosyltransferase family 2 protein [Clostridium sp.]